MLGDLVGKTINNLEILDEFTKGKRTFCKVRCICGKEFETRKDGIKNETTKSCGCLTRFKKKDITGKRYGKLVVEKYLRSEKKNTIWLCKCDCGNKTEAKSSSLFSGSKKSCGCLVKEKSKENWKKGFKTTKENMIDGTLITAIRNRKINKNNTSGIKGVWFDKKSKKWVAELYFQGKKYSLGKYENIEDATMARKKAEEKYFKPMIDKYENMKE